MKIKRLLVTTDFSEASRNAYPVAAALARQFGAKLDLVHVAEAMPPYFYLHGMGVYTDVPQDSYLEDLDRRLKQEEAAHESLAGLEVLPSLLYHGYPHEALNHFVHENHVDMVIISTHGHSGFGYALLGSFTKKVVSHAHVPVLTCHAGEELKGFAPQHVLVPIDFSENSRAVVPVVRFLAQNFRPKVTLLYCVEYIPPLVEMPVGGDFSAYLYRAIEEAPDRAREKFEELRQEDLQGVDMELHVAKGTPFKEILSHASDEEADLIVMATHGWTGLKHFLLGSITEKIIHKAPCSVLTIRSPDEGS